MKIDMTDTTMRVDIGRTNPMTGEIEYLYSYTYMPDLEATIDYDGLMVTPAEYRELMAREAAYEAAYEAEREKREWYD